MFYQSLKHNLTVFFADWRGKLIAYSVIGICAFTAVLPWWFPIFRDVAHFWGAFYASWLAGVLTFVATGLIIAAVTIPRPEQDLINTRVHNLLQRRQGPHIDYISAKLISLLEPYVDSVERDLTVIKYDSVRRMFQVNQDTKIVYKSYVEDADVTFPSRIGYREAPAPPPGEEPCCLAFLRIDGATHGDAEDFATEITRPFTIKIKSHSHCEVTYRMVVWIAVGEANQQLAIRFTRSALVRVHNHIGKRKIRVNHNGQPGTGGVIEQGLSMTVVNRFDFSPSDTDFLCDFGLDIEP